MKIICPYCKKPFDTENTRKRFCTHYHRMKYHALKLRGKHELFKLDDHELLIWKEIHSDQ